MKIPFIILCHQRPIQLMDMVESIEKYTDPDTYELILVDNASTQPEMRELLKSYQDKYTVIYNPMNYLFKGFNSALKLAKAAGYSLDKFILSDPDIVLTESMPRNWVTLLSSFLDEVPVPKAGVALDWTRIPDTTQQLRGMKECTQNIQSNPIGCNTVPDPYYIGSIDTTLAMYRNDTYDYWTGNEVPQIKIHHPKGTIIQTQYHPKYQIREPARIGGRFTCIHTGWEMESNPRYKTDFEAYKKSIDSGKSDPFIPSTMRYIRDIPESNFKYHSVGQGWR